MPVTRSQASGPQDPILMRRQNHGNGTSDEDEGHSRPKERTDLHGQSKLHHAAEPHDSQIGDPSEKIQSNKNKTEHLQAGNTSVYDFSNESRSRERNPDQSDSTTNQTQTRKVNSSTVIGFDAQTTSSNSSSSRENSSPTPPVFPPPINNTITANSTNASAPSSNNTRTTSSQSDAHDSFDSTQPTSFSNSVRIEPPLDANSSMHLQPPTPEPPFHTNEHSARKVWGIAMGSLLAFICAGAAIFFMRKRLKSTAAFVRRRLRSNSNDSNKAVRDRSSIGPETGVLDPFACTPTFSKKPLILRPETLGYRRPANPRRPSMLHLRHQSLKSQISAPIIEPSSPTTYQLLCGDSPGKSTSGASSRSNYLSSQPSYPSTSPHHYREHQSAEPSSKYKPGVSLTRDPYPRIGSTLSVRNPDMQQSYGRDKIDRSRSMSAAPPRPPRPHSSLLNCDSFKSNNSLSTVQEPYAPLPVILPLNTSRHSRSTQIYNQSDYGNDQGIRQPRRSCHHATSLPRYSRQQNRSVFSTDRETEAVRLSHLSRSSCYSQSSEQGDYTIPGKVLDSGADTPTSLNFVSFGFNQSSAQLEQQLDSFTSSKDANFASE